MIQDSKLNLYKTMRKEEMINRKVNITNSVTIYLFFLRFFKRHKIIQSNNCKNELLGLLHLDVIYITIIAQRGVRGNRAIQE